MGYDAPNYTQTPNLLLDEHLPDMGHAETKVVLVVVRKTMGWHKRADVISLTQLEKLTGLSRQGVLNGIEDAIERGVLQREKAGSSYAYSLVVNEVDYPPDQVVNEVDQGSQRSRPEVVNEVDPQKKRKETIPKERGNARARENTHPAIALVEEKCNKRLTPHQVKMIKDEVQDVQLLSKVLTTTLGNVNEPSQVKIGYLLNDYRRARDRQRDRHQRRTERGGGAPEDYRSDDGLTYTQALSQWQDESGGAGQLTDFFRVEQQENGPAVFYPTR